MGLFSDVQQSWNGFTTIYTRDTLKKPEIPAQNSEKRRIFFENHYFRKSNNLRNCSELVVSLVFELLKILIFIEDTGLFQMYNIHYETTLVLLENQYFE